MSTPRRSQARKSTTINLDDDSDLDMSLESIHDSDDSWTNEGAGGGRKGKKVLTKTKKKVTTKKTTTTTNLPGTSTTVMGLSQSSVVIKKTAKPKPVKVLKEKVSKAKKATSSTNSQGI